MDGLTGRPAKRVKAFQSLTSTELPSRDEQKRKAEHSVGLITDIPIDIMGEILSHLDPLDLLSLARTSKALRGLLMSNSSKAYWMTALSGFDGLPPCPKDVSEPLYVEIILSRQPYCFICMREDGDIFTCIEARTRLCDKFKFWHLLSSRDVDLALTHIIPTTHARLATNEKNQQEHYRFLCNDWRNKKRERFHVATANRLDRELKAFRNTNEMEDWLKKKKLEYQEIKDHADSCKRFWNAQQLQENRRIAEIKRLRAIEIEERLKALGWREDLRVSDRFVLHNHDLLAMDYPLTDSEWDEIKDELEAFLQQLRAKREAQLREFHIGERIRKHIQPAYNQCIVAQLPNPIIPLLPEVLLIDDFLTVLGNVPLEQDIPEGKLDDVIAKLPQLISGWKGALDERLLDILQKSTSYEGQVLSKDLLGYASTIFKCRSCKAPLSYPNVLAHECFYRTPQSRWAERSRARGESTSKRGLFTNEASETTADLVLENYLLFAMWEPGPLLIFHEAAHQHTVSLLDVLGLDKATTYEEMLERNPYVEFLCKCFHQPSGGKAARSVMRWTRALHECANHRSSNYEASFARIDEDDLKLRPGYHQAPGRFQRITTCPLCRKASGSVAGHLTTASSYHHSMSPDQEVLMQGAFLTEDSYKRDHIITIPK